MSEASGPSVGKRSLGEEELDGFHLKGKVSKMKHLFGTLHFDWMMYDRGAVTSPGG